MEHPWATWANALTAIRLAFIPAACLATAFGDWWLAAAIFTIATVSDALDGYVARRFNQASPLGGLFDHSTDALYVAGGVYALALNGMVTPWLAPLILIAFAQYMLDSRALAGQPLRASFLGRNNGIAYFVLLGTGIGYQALGLYWLAIVVSIGAWLLVVSTVLSILDRLWAYVKSR